MGLSEPIMSIGGAELHMACEKCNELFVRFAIRSSGELQRAIDTELLRKCPAMHLLVRLPFRLCRLALRGMTSFITVSAVTVVVRCFCYTQKHIMAGVDTGNQRTDTWKLHSLGT
jgi:hypothetical protein